MSEVAVTLGGKKLKLSNLEKVLYPAAGTTKAEVINYYRQIAPYILPHLKNRPVTLKRFPNGVAAPFFYEKRCPVHRPEWMDVADIPLETDEPLLTCLINSPAALIWVANLASIELHTQLHRATSLGKPNFVVFDLDPGPPAGLLECIPVALEMRDLLHEYGLESYPKVSGGKGLHFYVPLNTAVTFAQTKTFARAVAQTMEKEDPDRITSNMSRAGRAGKVFIDWSQNDQHKTTVCVYSLRAREKPSVSMPVTWDELETAKKRRNVKPLQFDIKRAIRRAEEQGDLFADVLKIKQKLPPRV